MIHFYNDWICGLITTFYYLKISHLISVIGNSEYKIILKNINELHNELSLQKSLDCIFIKRVYTNISSCLKVAIDKFLKGNKKQRVFYIFQMDLMKNMDYIHNGKKIYI